MVLADVLDESHKVIVILLALSIIVKSAPESIAIELGVCQLLILQFLFVVNEYVTEQVLSVHDLLSFIHGPLSFLAFVDHVATEVTISRWEFIALLGKHGVHIGLRNYLSRGFAESIVILLCVNDDQLVVYLFGDQHILSLGHQLESVSVVMQQGNGEDPIETLEEYQSLVRVTVAESIVCTDKGLRDLVGEWYGSEILSDTVEVQD